MVEKEWREGSICHWCCWVPRLVRQCAEEDGLRHAATLTNLLPNRDLACHKYVQAGSQPMAGDVGSFAFFPEESEVIGQMCSLDRVPKCGALNPP